MHAERWCALKQKDPAESLLRDARIGLMALMVLKLLVSHGPLHGYAVMKHIEELLGETPPKSTIYDALKRLEKLGLVDSYWARGPEGTVRKYYQAKSDASHVLEKVLRSLCSLIMPILRDADCMTG